MPRLEIAGWQFVRAGKRDNHELRLDQWRVHKSRGTAAACKRFGCDTMGVTMATELIAVSDLELARLALLGGPTCAEAQVKRQLRAHRAKDRQVYVFRVGDYYFTGPIPDARTEIAMLDLADDSEE